MVRPLLEDGSSTGSHVPWPLVIAGPTASGKSSLAMALAARLGGELVCADSRQVFQGMQIGAAAPTEAERQQVPHHGYNTVPATTAYDAGQFLWDTDRYVAEIQARGRVPILVGGSGLYLRSWRYGLADVPPRDDTVRQRLEDEVQRHGVEHLYKQLVGVDPRTAEAITRVDAVRIIRALEIHEITGQLPSELRKAHRREVPRVQAMWLLLEPPMEWLTPRLERRAQQMFDDGLVAEARRLIEQLGEQHRLAQTMGYEEAWQLAEGKLDGEEAWRRTARRQRQYARRQKTWFRKETWWHRSDPASPDFMEHVHRLVDETYAVSSG